MLRLATLLLLTFFAFSPLQGEEIAVGKTGEELRAVLRAEFSPTQTLSYKNARKKMFSQIDNNGGKVRLVYTGSLFPTSGIPNHKIVNTEHTWPQSKFKHGVNKSQMQSDLHHLFPTWNKVNNERGSFPFGEIPDASTDKWWNSKTPVSSIPTTNKADYSESISGVFEPREDHKGNVARSMLYFYTIYEKRNITVGWFNPQIPTLVQWHLDDPADDVEKERSRQIKAVQGNLNPFVFDETLATRIFDTRVIPTPFAAASGSNREVPGLWVRVHRPDNPPPAASVADTSDSTLNPLFPFEHINRRVNAESTAPAASFAADASSPDDGEIRIATFNIANLGATQEYKRSLITLTNILLKTNADLICLQEVQPNPKGKSQVRRLKELLNEAADFYNTKPYQYKISELDGGDELTAFLWRKPVVLDSNIESLPHDEDHDNDGKRTFQRVPQMASFHAGEYDFVVVNCHLYTKPNGNSSEGRKVENEVLASWLKAVATNPGEQDVILLGDLNRHLGSGGANAWKKLMINNHQDFYRFPLLEAIKRDHAAFNPLTHPNAPTDRHSTTASRSKKIYDQIIISKGSYAEFKANPVFGEDVGIVDFDNNSDFEWFTHNYEQTTDYLSDHRPVWIDLRFDGSDDD